MAEEDFRNMESEKVIRAKEGDREAFGELFNMYKDQIYNIAFRYVRESNTALDVTQEAFIKAFKNISDFKGESRFFTWLVRITINLAIDHQRKKSNRASVPFESYVEGGEIKPVKARPEPGPDGNAEMNELEKALAEAIGKLPENQRVVFLLNAVEGRAYKDIAEILDISIGTVMSRLHYARKKLRELLEGHLDATFSTTE